MIVVFAPLVADCYPPGAVQESGHTGYKEGPMNKNGVDQILSDIRSGQVNECTINLANALLKNDDVEEKYGTIVRATAGSTIAPHMRRDVNEVLQVLAKAEDLL
jgi:hypothetical protein